MSETAENVLSILEDAGSEGMHVSSLKTAIMGREWNDGESLEIHRAIKELQSAKLVWCAAGAIRLAEGGQAAFDLG